MTMRWQIFCELLQKLENRSIRHLDWSDRMICYAICNQYDEEIFKKQCKALEMKVPGIVKKDMLHDVDDSKTQIYHLNQAVIYVHNSHYLDEVYVESDIDLLQFFKNNN